MTYETPFEKALLAEARRTNELLELLVMAHMPMKIATGVPDPNETDEQRQARFEEVAANTQRLVAEGALPQPGEMTAAALQMLGLGRMPRGAGMPSEEERQARWAARAKEVGLPQEEADAAAQRVQTNLDTMKAGLDDGNGVEVVPPAKKAAAKRVGNKATGQVRSMPDLPPSN
jgi:hypothetical protein